MSRISFRFLVPLFQALVEAAAIGETCQGIDEGRLLQGLDLRRTLSAIVWRHDNGAKWRSVPPHLGPWWRAAQLSIRWSKLGVWQRLLELCQQGGLSLGVVFLDGTVITPRGRNAERR